MQIKAKLVGFLGTFKENNKTMCNTFDHNFKNINLYIMRKVSFERYYFVLYVGALTLKRSKWRLTRFVIKKKKLFKYLLGPEK